MKRGTATGDAVATDLISIEIDSNDSRTFSQDIRISKDLLAEIITRTRVLFKRCYINPQRPSNPVVENTMKLTNDKSFSCTSHRLSYGEKTKLRHI